MIGNRSSMSKNNSPRRATCFIQKVALHEIIHTNRLSAKGNVANNVDFVP